MRILLLGFFQTLKMWLEMLAKPAADPRQTYGNAHERQQELLIQVQQALGAIVGTKQRLESQTAAVRAKLPQLQDRARDSLVEGREDQARLALQRRQVVMVELQTLEEQMQDVEKEEHRMALIEQRLATQIEAFYARQELIAARYNAAEAQVRIREAFSGVSQELSELGRALERAEEKSEHMQARAAAIDRLVEDGILESPTSAPTAYQLGCLGIASDVEEQLAMLKSELQS